MKYQYLYYEGKRPNDTKNRLGKELINFVKEEGKNKHFPSRRELEGKFHLKLGSLFGGINDLYSSANLKYKPAPNQELKIVKANLLLQVILDNLDKFGLTLVEYRRPSERGIDIVTEKKGKKVGIEIKAYSERERLKVRDINQVLRFVYKENLSRAIIITTTNLEATNLVSQEKIDIINYNKLFKVLGPKYSEKFDYIREASVNVHSNAKDIKRQKILDYVSNKYFYHGDKPTCNDILKNVNLDVYTYFNSLFDVYKTLEIPPPTSNMGGKRAKNPDKEVIELWKNEFKKYIIKEVRTNGRYPSGQEIGKQFGISHVWNIVTVSELYLELGLKPYRERSKRNLTSFSDV